MVGLVLGWALLSYQSSLLDQERLLLLDEADLYGRLDRDCKLDLAGMGGEREEQLQQLGRIKEGLLLDKEILTQLKVNMQHKISVGG